MSHASPEDLSRTLLTRLREGDAEAGALLEQLHREPLRRFALRYLHHADDAEDVVQEVFARAGVEGRARSAPRLAVPRGAQPLPEPAARGARA